MELTPIINITWADAFGYCGWAGGRLPTEAEWEYAARGGSTEGRYGPIDSVAWYDQNSGSEWHEVAQKRPNGFGLFDVLGDVWQWVGDWYDPKYYEASPQADPSGPSAGVARVLRGGSWFNTSTYSRVSYRNKVGPDKVNTTYGFRCASDSAPTVAAQSASHVTVVPTKRPVDVTPSQQSTSSATKKKENPRDGLRYVWIPPGTFQMGCSPGDAECYESEKPLHQVTLTRGFWMGQTDVTVEAYKRYSAATGAALPANQKSDQHPVVNVNWNDAAAYCRWVGGRLPTDAEWEYAARGGSTENRYGPINDIAWYDLNSGNEWHEVGQKRPNAFGLFDMLGNVWQWVDSWWDLNYYKTSPSVDPPGLASGQTRVMRGGSWYNTSLYSRASMRNYSEPANPNTTFGIRCVADGIGP